MAAITSQGCAFIFNGAQFDVVSVSVESPTPEVVNMTSQMDGLRTSKMVATGDWLSSGSVTVEGLGLIEPAAFVGVRGAMSFQTRAGVINRTAICTSASVEATVGSLLRIRMTFTPTDA